MDDTERSTCELLQKNEAASNEQTAQSNLRPIPGIFPRCPYVVNEAYSPFPRNETVDNFPQMVPQINSSMDGQQQIPYFTTIVQPVSLAVASSLQPNQPRIVYAQQPVQGIAIRPYVNQVYCQGIPPMTSPYQPGVRYQTPISNQQNYRAKPGSVHGIPPEPQRATTATWDTRSSRPYDLLLQPEAMRIFNNYKNVPSSSKDKKLGEKPSQSTEFNRNRNDGKTKGTVHIGGILTLPKSSSCYNEESSQNSTGSSLKDDELKPSYMQPGIMLFRKLAEAGFEDLKKTIVKYGVKSSKEDLEALCDEVRTELRSTHTGAIQMEPVLREIILAYIRICSSWSSLVSVLPTMREQPHPSEEWLVKEFLNWQEVSTAMLQRILDALEVLPSEHERCISGLARSCEPQPNEPRDDGDKGAEGENKFRRPCATPVDVSLGYPPLPGYVYQTYPGCDIQLTVPRIELSPSLQLDDPVWAHLYPQLDSE